MQNEDFDLYSSSTAKTYFRTRLEKEKSISYTLNYDYDFNLEDAKKVEEFMLPMLIYDAEKRISAEKALESEFLK